MKIPVFCAGALKVRLVSFIAAVAAARIIRYFALAYLGQRYGRDTLAFVEHHSVDLTRGSSPVRPRSRDAEGD